MRKRHRIIAARSAERGCLKWIAGGRASVEAAEMMELSEHMVTHYLTNAANKVNAANLVHVVAITMRLKFLPR
jgi:LuxR family transcriptional regulator, quorum-sensing system regulator BjaR1